jgi:hypothetical protein
MDAHVFLILLLASLPLAKLYGDSRWIYLVPAAWALLFITFDLSRTVTRFEVNFTAWLIAIFLLLGFRYRRFFGLERGLGWAHWLVLFVFYVLSVWIDAALVMSSKRAAASGTILADTLYTFLGMAIVGFMPLAMFWVYRLLTKPVRTEAN